MCRALGGPRRVPHSFATAQGRFVRAFIAVVPPASIIQRVRYVAFLPRPPFALKEAN